MRTRLGRIKKYNKTTQQYDQPHHLRATKVKQTRRARATETALQREK